MEDKIERARVLLGHLVDEDFDEAEELLNDTLRGYLPPILLEKAWMQVQERFGNYEGEAGEGRAARYQNLDIVELTCQFATAPLTLRVVFDEADLVTGLAFEPVEDSAADSATDSTAPPGDDA